MQVLKPHIRRKILDAAERMFFDYGFDATSTRSIAREVDISVGNLYKYFKDKNDIFAAVVEPFYAFVRDDIDALFTEDHAESPEESTGEIFSTIMNMMKRDRYRFVILINRSRGTAYGHIKGELVDSITRHMRESISREAVNDDYVLHLIAANLIEGILKAAERYHDDLPSLEACIDILVRHHMRGIGPFIS